MLHNVLILLFALSFSPLHAIADAALDQRVQRLAEELRCLVCQNQSLADSSADLAVDLKNQVREKLQQGASEKDVIAYMTERYGDFVLYRPPMKASTMLLWFGPGLFLIGGLIALFRRLRSRARVAAEPPLTSAERARAADLLGNQDHEHKTTVRR